MPGSKHAIAAELFNADEPRTNWHDETLWFVRQKRDKAAHLIPDWEALREAASQIKNHTLSNLDDYLTAFEARARSNGVTVHWAADAAEHNEIILGIIRKHGIERIVKSKSMLTEECHLNDFLAKQGVQVTDTDLGECIVQLRKEPPSHIVLPAIHLKKEDVSDTFHEHLGTEKGNISPEYLAAAARSYLRNKFVHAQLAITGVNFAVAETGAVVVCTNEGNADIGVHAADIHIACMGIEKVIPQTKHLGVFLRLLARSATGQSITAYSSHFSKPVKGKEMHIVIVDNGRSTQLGRSDFRNSLKCIRCAACFNTCPVYRRSGGYSYHTTVAGPIGSILAPNLDLKAYSDLPFSSTLCGSCTNVCPVKINIHEQLWKWRQEVTKHGYSGKGKTIIMNLMAGILSSPVLYRVSGKLARWTMRHLPFLMKSKQFNLWYKQLEMPEAPAQSFTEWYKSNIK